MNYYFGYKQFLDIQGEIIKFIEENYKDTTYYSDFIEVLENNDIEEKIILDDIDRGYIYDYIEYSKMYEILENENDLNEIIDNEFNSYFMDCSLISILENFNEIPVSDIWIYTDIYKFKNDYYIVFE